MKRLSHLLMLVAVALLGAAAGRDAFDQWVNATDLPPIISDTSVEVLDRDGRLLRAFTVADGRWRLSVTPEGVDPRYLDMLIRFEDKRFYDHHGVDLWAMTRAMGQAVTSGRIVSGGSTLTMQVARLLEDSGTGRWSGKLRQVRVALALERTLTKEEILTLYLTHAPFGGNLEGVRAASYAYFGKPPERVTLAEAALLVALPQSPETRRPDRHPQIATQARDRVLQRMADAGALQQDEALSAMAESGPTERAEFPMLAAHLADRVVSGAPALSQHRLTIDGVLQARLERLAAETVQGRSDRLQIAIMVADHQSGEILASVGSAGYQADETSGFIDLTQAVRSPGSTLKPLIYGLAFHQGVAHPETMIDDRPTDFSGYRPQNFDGEFHGAMRVRTALQISLNIPAVALLERIGPQQLIAALRRSGVDPQLPGGQPGLAIALGGLGITLEDLVRSYAGLANGGIAVDVHATQPNRDFVPRRILGGAAAWQVADILREVPRPSGTQGDGIAFKTGTSYGHRDAWAVGFDGQYVVGVWMGRADGTPVPGAFGGELAAPVLFNTFARISPRVVPLPAAPSSVLVASTANLPLPLQHFRPRGEVVQNNLPRIAFPPNGSIVEGSTLFARVSDGQPPFTWLANGAPVTTSRSRQVEIPLGTGFSTLTVIDGSGLSAQADFELR